MNRYLIFGIIFLILILLEVVYFRIAAHFNIIDKPNERSSHKSIVLRGGGVIFPIGVLVWLVACLALGRFELALAYLPFVCGLMLISVVSFWDDVRSLPDSVRLVAQFIAMTLMFWSLGILHLEMWWIVLLGLVLCVGIINAYNFMDGINGITGGYSLAVLVPLWFMNNRLAGIQSLRSEAVAGSFVDETFLVVAIIAVVVFCLFNFRRKAKCFAGDVGSVSIAFIIVFALGKLILFTGDFTYIVFLAVYGVDSVLTICHRILLHENLGKAHRKHAYQLMANELHLPHPLVSLVYMLLQMVVSVGMIYIPATAGWHWGYLAFVCVVLALAYLLFMKKYYHLHEEYLASLNQ